VIARLSPFAILLALISAMGTAAEPTPTPAGKSEPFDLLYLSDAGPVVVRLHLTIANQPLSAAWTRFADALFTALDSDKSGGLDQAELARLRPVLTFLTGRTAFPGGAVIAPMNRAGLAAYLRQNDLGPLRLPVAANNPRATRSGFRRGGTPTTEQLDKALMELLDTNADGKLSTAELTAGVEILGRLDVDENEMISMDELLRRPASSPFFVEEIDGRMLGEPVGAGVELLALSLKADANLARRLLARYGPKPAGGRAAPVFKGPRPAPPVGPIESTARRLTPADLKISAAAFAALDQDGDGTLDTEELARLGQSAPRDVEIALRLRPLTAETKFAEVLAAGKPPVKVTVGARGAEVALEVPGVRLDFLPAARFDAPGAPSADEPGPARSAFRMRYVGLFGSFDRDGNGYLDRTEANAIPLFRELFSFLDRNGDGKVFEQELKDALDEVDPIARAAESAMASIDLREAGRGLFGLIDADGDGRFSVRELRAMAKLVERFDANHDGAIAPGEVPRLFEATLSSGLPNPGYGPRVVAIRADGTTGSSRTPVGPLWFQKMDRNRDGDVSRREFLGSDADFRKLDTNNDGLISPQEAEAAGKK
jgi:Ca2+-binding EF-hand superfamily protein